MIHRHRYNGPISFECDVCGKCIDTNDSNFNDALNIAKGEDWTVRKIGNDWFHFCSFDCQKQSTRENRSKLPKVHQMDRIDAIKWLGLSENSSKDEIKSAYLRLIKVCHPDHGGSTSLTQLLNEAYEIVR